MDAISPLREGVLSAAALRERLGVSPATLMRAVRDRRSDILRIGQGRATRYGLIDRWPGSGVSKFPLVRVSPEGSPKQVGELYTLAAGETAWMPEGEVSRGLPLELADARPAGFLGRHFAALHPDLPLPARTEDWSDHHILLALSRRGEDLAGNLLLGDESFARWQTLQPVRATRNDYPQLAEATIAGHPPGSSAGGERPKFGVLVDGRHQLVKFVGGAESGQEVARRWRDLLVLEGLALEAIAAQGIPTATTHLVTTPQYWFLESERFDRIGDRGRVAVLSLAAAHDNPADSWARAATTLQAVGRLTAEHATRLRWLDAFGALIANTDRHAHNIVFFTGGSRLELAPAFDQLPMLYAPSIDGQLPPRTFARPSSTVDTLEVWEGARAAATAFWERASREERLSDSMRRISEVNARRLTEP